MSHTVVKVGIAANPNSEKSLQIVCDLIAWLDNRSIEYRIDSSIIEKMPKASCNLSWVINRQDIAIHCDPIVVLGGDGTLLSVCRHAFSHAPVVIGVNVGRLGFLAEVDIKQMYDVLSDALSGLLSTSLRRLLEVKIFRSGELFAVYHAVNDAVITKDALARIFELEISMDDKLATIIRGDGLIIATSVGSTAYSLAAGGAIVHPALEAVLITPICPHPLSVRPLVMPGEFHVSARICRPDDRNKNSVLLTIDGQEGTHLQHKDVVVATLSSRAVRLAQSPSLNYFEILTSKLRWGEQVNQGIHRTCGSE